MSLERRKTHKEYLDELERNGLSEKIRPIGMYITYSTKIRHRWIECNHVVEVSPQSVLNGYGCRICRKYSRLANVDTVVERIHGGDIWRDSSTPYINSSTKVIWNCVQGHHWEATPQSVTNGTGCPHCSNGRYKGERLTRGVLEEHGIEFQVQKKFPDLKRIDRLSYDFFIPSMNILIECQGVQHYKPTTFFHGENAEEGFAYQQERDQLKREYAWQNGYYLLEISYKDYRKDRIKAILEDAGVLQKQPA